MSLRLPPAPRIVGVVGNPKGGSRTLRAARALADAVAARTAGTVGEIVDLVTLGGALFTFGSPEVKRALDTVLAADAIVVATPVYKASYTGVLKSFFDHVSQGQLAPRVAFPLMVGGAPIHALAVEVHLRPLLVEVGATCVTPGLYVLEAEIEQVERTAADYAGRLPLG